MARLSSEKKHEYFVWEAAAWGRLYEAGVPERVDLPFELGNYLVSLCSSEYLTHRIPQFLSALASESEGETTILRDAVSRAEVEGLRKTVHQLQERVKLLEERLGEAVLVVREVSRSEAKAQVLSYFRQNPDSYPSDAALALSLDPAFVRDLAAELVSDGLLQG